MNDGCSAPALYTLACPALCGHTPLGTSQITLPLPYMVRSLRPCPIWFDLLRPLWTCPFGRVRSIHPCLNGLNSVIFCGHAPPTALPNLCPGPSMGRAGRDRPLSVPGGPPQQLIDNHTRVDKYFVVSGENSSELHVQNLHLEQDPGKYSCEATNSEGHGSAMIELRVRKHLAALWPFLGIVAEVLVLVTIIFVYEKRQKKDDQVDGEAPTNPLGGAPLSVRGCWDPGQLPHVPGWRRLWRQTLAMDWVACPW